uniref:Uncharacterized protein n=1 Tax=Gadus morhua TaxID=8049 RepID=A0A8C4ZW28_GADMO
VAEDHGLGDGDGSVDVAEGLELLLLAGALHVVLLDGVQRLLLALQLDDVWVGDDALGEHTEWCPRPLDADALVLVALRGDHDVRLVQHKHLDHLGVDELKLDAPVQHGPRGADDDLLLELHAPLHWSEGKDRQPPESNKAALLKPW